jgi:hypothetical protein
LSAIIAKITGGLFFQGFYADLDSAVFSEELFAGHEAAPSLAGQPAQGLVPSAEAGVFFDEAVFSDLPLSVT